MLIVSVLIDISHLEAKHLLNDDSRGYYFLLIRKVHCLCCANCQVFILRGIGLKILVLLQNKAKQQQTHLTGTQG